MKVYIYGVHIWYVELFWGKLYCVRYSFRSFLGYVCLMEYVVFRFWYNVTAVFSMCCP